MYENDKEDKGEKVFELNPVVVTGNGHRQLLKSTTTPVHVVSQQLIKETGVTDFQQALSRLIPQISFSPNAMGSYIRVNGLGNKYILVLVNGKRMIGDIAGNVDLSRIDMSRVKRIEVLDGAASALYGSDAIGGVINIITEQQMIDRIHVSSDTRLSGKGEFSEGVNLDISSRRFSSSTSYFHQEADPYQNSPYVMDESTGELSETIAPLFIGFNSHNVGQKFEWSPADRLSLYAAGSYTYKLTDRPDSRSDVEGGSDYDMRSEGSRWEMGGRYHWGQHTVQLDITNDNYQYGNLYQVATSSYEIGDFVRSKRQKYYEAELKGIFRFYPQGTTVIGADWRNDFLETTSGDVDNHVHTIAGYAQHDMEILRHLSATVGARLTRHGTFGTNFTPKLSLMYAPGNLRLRAAYSRGFRAPGLDELYYHYFKIMGKRPVITFGNKELSPERSHYASLGAEYHHQRFSLSVMGYMNFVKDMIVKDNITIDDDIRQTLAQEFPEATAEQLQSMKTYGNYINSDKGIVKGFQINFSAHITPELSLMANYAYTHGRTKSGGEWSLLERTFKNSATASINYLHDWKGYRLNLHLNGRFQSKTYYPAYEDAPGYGILNFHTTHTFDSGRHMLLVPSIGVDNIFNKRDCRYDTSTRRYALYSPGCMLVVGLKLQWKQ